MLHFLKTGLGKIKQALSKTRNSLKTKLQSLFKKPWNQETLETLEQILYESDLGTACIQELLDYLQTTLQTGQETDIAFILEKLKQKSLDILQIPPKTTPKTPLPGEPLVMLIVGINGSGKTTSIAKLASMFKQEGKKVLLGSGDTFRAAAVDQLNTWAEKLKIDIVKSKPGADPAAVAFDTISSAKARNIDVVLLDTAGRLQNKTDLMQELAKIQKTCAKALPFAPHETILVLDATTGQNGLDQARLFHQTTPLTGIILTKLDGSAKGGIVLSMYKELGIPIRWIGTGEQAQDLTPFSAEEYVQALLDND